MPSNVVDAFEPNDGATGDAPELDLVKGATATVGFRDDQLDVYRVVAPDHGVLPLNVSNLHVHATTTHGALNRISVTDAHKVELTSIHQGFLSPTLTGASQPIAVAKSETYFVLITPLPGSANAAPYTLGAHFDPIDLSNEPNRNDTTQQATAIKVGDSRRELVGFGDDPCDYYRLEPREDATLVVAVANCLDRGDVMNGTLAFKVLNSKQAVIETIHPGLLGPAARSTTNPFQVVAGETYFLCVARNQPTGAAPYSISVTKL